MQYDHIHSYDAEALVRSFFNYSRMMLINETNDCVLIGINSVIKVGGSRSAGSVSL